MEIKIPELSLVALVGVSGSGKSSFARKHFKATEIVSSDTCRGIVSDDENSLKATDDAFDLLEFIVSKRLKNGLLTVIDATNVQPDSRKKIIQKAREFHSIPVAIVLDIPEKVCQDRNINREDRNFGKHVIRQQKSQLRKSLRSLKKEGFRHIHILKSEDEVNAITEIVREKLYNDKRELSGPFDIIGDIHGCIVELNELLVKLGYAIVEGDGDTFVYGFKVSHPENRQVVFLGDLVDRGIDSPKVLKLVMSMVKTSVAYCVPGNHDMKLQKKLNGKKVQLKHGLELTMQQLEGESAEFLKELELFLYSLVSHYVFDQGRLVVSHAGIKEEMQGRGSGAIRAFCLFGETTGEIDEFGLPVRYNWATDYRGDASIVYGHTPVPEPEWFNNTINIDTGCVFGGKLTALRYPEKELVSIPAKEMYYKPAKPIETKTGSLKLSLQHESDDLLFLEDVLGKNFIHTRLRNTVTIKEENSIAALEAISRFAINPKWLIYMPPAMSPSETSEHEMYLEHPAEALKYYKNNGIKKVVCEQKHMGSRAVVVICKDENTVVERFGIENDGIGKCFTRTGKNFFSDSHLEVEFLSRIQTALSNADFWNKHKTDWVCLDCELMPWSEKAQALLKNQYASVGVSATVGLDATVEALSRFSNRRNGEGSVLLQSYQQKRELMNKYIASYQNYCWTVNNINDFKLAPFHILATEGEVHTDKDHVWHMSNIAEICKQDTLLLLETPYKVVDFDFDTTSSEAIAWWEKLTANGGEGMVVKPMDFISFGKKGLVQPAVKCRGVEYLRIIYGPEYTIPNKLNRLKSRGLSRKRSLAIREFALGIEALERFVRKEPLRKIHECVFGVLSLESEAVDPRL